MDIYMYKFVYTHFLNNVFYHHLFEKNEYEIYAHNDTRVYKYIL